jgi:SAM-dependent methyltransferase
MYKSWEEIEEKDTNNYVVGTLSGNSLTNEEYDVSGLIDSGKLLDTMRRYMGYTFLGKDILEFGTGNGRMTKHLRHFFGEYTAMDISETMLGLLREKVDASIVRGNGTSIPIKPVDIIFTFTVLMHNKKSLVPKIVEQFNKVLKPGGYLFMQLPCYSTGHDISEFDGVTIWTPDEIRVLGGDFEILHIADSERELGSQISPQHFEYHVLRRVV